MKTRKTKLFAALMALTAVFDFGFAQAPKNSTREIILQAMRDEMKRNMQRLQMENLQKPFFISFTIRDVKTMAVMATLGAVVRSSEDRFRTHNVRVMVGDYHRTDENFSGGGGMFRQTLLQGADALPIEDDYNGVRRGLWMATDNVYKSASETYERKKAALEQQTQSEEDKALDDFARAPVIKFSEPARTLTMPRAVWEKNARELAAAFRNYPDIYESQVRVSFYQADVYFLNSEGTETTHPLTLATVQVNASTQANDGEPLDDHALFYATAPENLPPVETMKQAAVKLAEELVALRNAPVFEDSYSGPVMFEGQAAAELLAQRLFTGNNGLLASRRPLRVSEHPMEHPSEHPGQRSAEETLEDKINTRVLSKDLTIKALPKLQLSAGQKLIGTNLVDEEGVQPPEEIILVENGMLKTLLNGRIPTKAVRESNGHSRPIVGMGANSSIGPSVIAVTTAAGKAQAEMNNQLLEQAKTAGLDHAIIVRKIKSPNSGAERRFDPMAMLTMMRSGGGAPLSDPLLVYRIWVKDGREELVRSAKLGSLSLSALRRMVSASQEQIAYNTLVGSGGGGVLFMFGPSFSASGIPASFIVPQALIFEELEVKKAQREFTPKLPVVSSPLKKK